MNYIEAANYLRGVDEITRHLNLLRRLDDMFFRQSGRTINNILSCPKNSIYVCPSDDVRYYRDMAWVNHRTDIKFVGPDIITNRRYLGMVLNQTPIVFDHATAFSANEWTDFYMDVCYV